MMRSPITRLSPFKSPEKSGKLLFQSPAPSTKRISFRYILSILIAIALSCMMLMKYSVVFPKPPNDYVEGDSDIYEGISKSFFDDFSFHLSSQTENYSNGKCWSMKEAKYYYPPSSLPPPSPELLQAFRSHEALQEKCTLNVKDWNAHFHNLENGFENCKYVIWLENGQGLGNRLLSLISAFTYALLTNRALLADNSVDMEELICNPFPNAVFFLPKTFSINSTKEAYTHLQYFENYSNLKNSVKNLYVIARWFAMHYNETSFFCDMIQNVINDVPWLAIDTEMYIVPGFYYSSRLRMGLDVLFPKRLIISYISRYLLFPTNIIWEKITRVFQTYFANANTRIGIQIRNFGPYNPDINPRIYSCLKENEILPEQYVESEYLTELANQNNKMADNSQLQYIINMEKSNDRDNKGHTNNYKNVHYSVFVTSLHFGYYSFLKKMLTTFPNVDGSLVLMHTESFEGQENHSFSQNSLAMIDIWLLSMSHKLLTSYISTFGYVAKALSGQPAYMLNICELYHLPAQDTWTSNNKSVCQLSRSSEACFLVKPLYLVCSAEQNHDAITTCDDAVEGITVLPLV